MHSAMNTALAPRSIALSIKRVMSPKLWIPRRGSVKYLYAVNLAQPKEETLRSLYAGSLLTRRGPRCIGVVWGYGSRLHVHQQHEVKAPPPHGSRRAMQTLQRSHAPTSVRRTCLWAPPKERTRQSVTDRLSENRKSRVGTDCRKSGLNSGPKVGKFARPRGGPRGPLPTCERDLVIAAQMARDSATQGGPKDAAASRYRAFGLQLRLSLGD